MEKLILIWILCCCFTFSSEVFAEHSYVEGLTTSPENLGEVWVAGSNITVNQVQGANAPMTTWNLTLSNGTSYQVTTESKQNESCEVINEMQPFVCDANCIAYVDPSDNKSYIESQIRFCQVEIVLNEAILTSTYRTNVSSTSDYKFQIEEYCLVSDPESPDSPRAVQVPPDSSGVDSQAIFVCKVGYEMVEEMTGETATCLYNATWSSVPECEIKCLDNCTCASNACCNISRECVCPPDVGIENFACDMNDLSITTEKENYNGILNFDDVVTMTVYVNALPKDVDVTVTKPNGSTESLESLGSVYTLEVEVSSPGVEGRYNFTVYSVSYPNINGTDFSYLQVDEPAVIDSAWEGQQQIANEGDFGFYIDCKVSGTPPPSVSWYLPTGNDRVSELKLPTRIYQELVSNNTMRLYIRPESGLLTGDTGNYYCRTNNSVGDNATRVEEFATLSLIVRDTSYQEVAFATQQSFLIGVCILGAILLLVIVVFVVFFIKLHRSSKVVKAEEKKRMYEKNMEITRIPDSHTNLAFHAESEEEDIYEDVIS